MQVEYLAAEIHRLLAEDSRIAEQGVTVQCREGTVVLGGEVESAHRRDQICEKVAGHFPEMELTCDIGVTRAAAPTDVEEIS
jgi:hypothetical protein